MWPFNRYTKTLHMMHQQNTYIYSFKSLFVTLIFSFFLFAETAHSIDLKLEKMSYSVLPGNQIEIALDFNQAAPRPSVFPITNPARLVLDFPGVQLSQTDHFQKVGIGVVNTLNAVEANQRSRIVIDLVQSVPYTLSILDQRLIVSLGKTNSNTQNNIITQETDTLSSDQPQTTDLLLTMPTAYTEPSLLNIDFRRGEEGGGHVIIDLSKADIQVELSQEGKYVIATFKDSILPERLDRTLDVKDFATPAIELDTRVKQQDVEMRILVAGKFEYLGYQTNKRYVIEVKQAVPNSDDVSPC